MKITCHTRSPPKLVDCSRIASATSLSIFYPLKKSVLFTVKPSTKWMELDHHSHCLREEKVSFIFRRVELMWKIIFSTCKKDNPILLNIGVPIMHVFMSSFVVSLPLPPADFYFFICSRKLFYVFVVNLLEIVRKKGKLVINISIYTFLVFGLLFSKLMFLLFLRHLERKVQKARIRHKLEKSVCNFGFSIIIDIFRPFHFFCLV